MSSLLQEHHVLPTRFYQMVGDTRASHPTTDDHGLRFVLQQSSLLSAYLVSIGCYANWAVHSLQLAVRLAFISYSLTLSFGVLGVGTLGRLQLGLAYAHEAVVNQTDGHHSQEVELSRAELEGLSRPTPPRPAI